jgi:hypothetical protein
MEKKGDYYPEPYPMTDEERKAALAKVKASFTAADLQRFTEIEEGIPLDDVLKELEEIDRKSSQASP